MRIETTRFGAQDVKQDSIIHFPDGLLMDSKVKDFKLFHKEDAEPGPVVFWLQSVENPDKAYTIIDPSLVGFSYEVALPDEDYNLLDSSNTDEIAVMVIITGAEDGIDNVQKDGFALISGKMTEPLFINLNSKKGMQRSIKELDYDIFLTIPVTNDCDQ